MLLGLTFFLLIFGSILFFFIPERNIKLLRQSAIFLSSSVLAISLVLLYFFDINTPKFQYVLTVNLFNSQILNSLMHFGIDGISIFFFVLTSLLIFLCIIFIWDDENFKKSALTLLILEFLLFFTFSTLNLFLFYVFFECILIPMFLLIGFWGSREKKIRAAYILFFYTVCGSILMLIAIFYIYNGMKSIQNLYISINN